MESGEGRTLTKGLCVTVLLVRGGFSGEIVAQSDTCTKLEKERRIQSSSVLKRGASSDQRSLSAEVAA